MTPQYGIVFVTAGTHLEAETIARNLVEAKLAACVSLTPIHSIYTWQDKICSEQEWQLVIKTDLALLDQIILNIQATHSYEVPEIIALPIAAGSSSYLNWISEQVGSK
ncbi:MAG: divalent-cation tolerance protein CutA [Microcoleaceae cyanobacterium]